MASRRPSFRQLEAFLAVMETLSISRAAQRLHISQPAMSELISGLEAEIGVALFQRIRGRLQATAEAELLRVDVEGAALAVNRASARARELSTFAYGSLSLSAFPALASTLLPRFLARFRGEYPGIRFRLSGANWRQSLDDVAAQRVDLAITALPATRDGVQCQHFARYRAVCVVRPDHPVTAKGRITPRQIAETGLISLGEEDDSRAAIEAAFRGSGVRPPPAIQVTMASSACAWVAEAGGCAIVDPFVADQWAGKLVAIQVVPEVTFDLWLLQSDARPLSLCTSHFVEQLRMYWRECMGPVG